jgi:hypothetical protein
MKNLSTLEVLEILSDYFSDEIGRLDLLSHAVESMTNDEAYMRPGSDTMIKGHLSDMMFLTQRPQDLLLDHIKFLKTNEMCKL